MLGGLTKGILPAKGQSGGNALKDVEGCGWACFELGIIWRDFSHGSS